MTILLEFLSISLSFSLASALISSIKPNFRCTEIPDPKAGTGHNHNHHTHTTKYNANSNDLYKSYKQPHQPHRPPKVTYQPISDDDDLFGSAEEYDDSDSQNVYLKPTKAPNDNGFNGNGNSNNNHHYHHHQYNANNNNNANNARYNNVPLFGNGIGGVGGVGGGGGAGSSNGANNNGIVTRTEVRGSDNELTAATASAANIIFAFYKQNSHNDNNNSYSNYKLLLVINLLISVFSRLISS